VRLGGDWRDSGMAGMFKFINRVWTIAQKIIKASKPKTKDDTILKISQKTIKKVGEDLEKLKFNTAIAFIMEYVNALYDAVAAKKEIGNDAIEILTKLISPFTPFLAEELWSSFAEASEDKNHLKYKESVFKQSWPEYDASLVKDETIELVIQINGKVRARLAAPVDISEKEAQKLVMSDTTIQKWLVGKEPKRVIFVKGRLVNVVL
jgi:leucyl-tRNA synthetase